MLVWHEAMCKARTSEQHACNICLCAIGQRGAGGPSTTPAATPLRPQPATAITVHMQTYLADAAAHASKAESV